MKRHAKLDKLFSGKLQKTTPSSRLATQDVNADSDNGDEELIRVGGAAGEGDKPEKRRPILISTDSSVSTLTLFDESVDVHTGDPLDLFTSRFVNSSADLAVREAELSAARALASLGDVCTLLPPSMIGASAESDTATRLHGGVTGVAISASNGRAHDDLVSRVKEVASLYNEQLPSESSSLISNRAPTKLLSCRLEEPRHGAVESSVAKAWLSSYGREPAALRAANCVASSSTGATSPFPFTPLQHLLWGSISSYRDVSFCLRSEDNSRELRSLLALHIASHVSKARALVSDHDKKIREAHLAIQASRLAAIERKAGREPASASPAELGAANAHKPRKSVAVPEFRDQGFSRPRVLVLLPMRHGALRLVRSLLRLLQPGRQVVNRARFFAEFGDECEGDADVQGKLALAGAAAVKEAHMLSDEDDDDVGGSGEVAGHSRYPFGRFLKAVATGVRSTPLVAHYADEPSDAGHDIDVDTLLSGHRLRKRGRRLDRTEREAQRLQSESILGAVDSLSRDAKIKRKMAKRHEAEVRRQKQEEAANPVPPDFSRLFSGNIDDDFRIGISVSSAAVRLFCPFDASDIIVASPLGLRRIIGGEGDEEGGREIDFLSSIEIVAVDQADVLLQQNWQHVKDVFAVLNKRPLQPGATDFSRVREADLAGCGRFVRQTILFSSYLDADFSSLLRRNCYNDCGSVAIRASSYAGSILRVVASVRQCFVRVGGSSAAQSSSEADVARIAEFEARILPLVRARQGTGRDGGSTSDLPSTIVYVASYLEYVRLRNLLDRNEVEFVAVSEYSEERDVAQARSAFRRGDAPILILTERAHFFRRIRIQGARNAIFFGVPRAALFYPEVLNWLRGRATDSASPLSALVLFTKFDALQLERVVGSERAARMLTGDKSTFVLV